MSAVVTVPPRTAAITRTNAVTRLLMPLPLTLVLVLSLDWVSAATALVLELLFVPFLGLGWRQLALRTSPILVAAPFTGLTMLLYGQPGGVTYWQWGWMQVSDGSIEIAVATTLRVLAIALPAVILFITVDPTDLADGLAQVLRLPSRFVLGALAGLRLVGLFLDDWRQLSLARRARGVADTGRVRRFFAQALALLVLAIRRGSKLATAMEARGFGGDRRRTWARASVLGAPDIWLIAVGVLIAVLSVTVSVASGAWNLVLGG